MAWLTYYRAHGLLAESILPTAALALCEYFHLAASLTTSIYPPKDTMSNTITVTADTFRSTVIESDKPVLVDFWAEWCGPCKKLSPILDEVAAELGDEAIVAKVNVDEQRQLGAMFQIMSIPTVLIFKDGQKVADIVGAQPKSTYVAKVRSLA